MKITFVYGIGMQLPTPLISVSYLAASIKASGRHEVSLIDCFLRKNKSDYIFGRIKEEKPDVIGFSVMSSYVRGCLELAGEIKKRFPSIRITFGGSHAVLRPGEIIACGAVDSVCTGEGEDALVEYLDALSAGREPLVNGYWFRDREGRVVKNPPRPLIRDLDRLPYPDWDIWDMKRYLNAYMYVMASRGCPFSCAYCCSATLRNKLCSGDPKSYYRVRSARNVIGEIKRNLGRYGYRGFQPLLFCDSLFGYDKKQFEEFTDLFTSEGLHKVAPWKCMVVANGVDEAWAARAKAAGCFAVDMGLEHPDEKIRMGKLGKIIADAEFSIATSALARHKIPYELYLMLGSKGETVRDSLRNIRMAARLKPIFFCLNIFVPLPDTRLWDDGMAEAPGNGGGLVETRRGQGRVYLSLIWCVKVINQLVIINLARRLHGFRRMFAIFTTSLARLRRLRPFNMLDFMRLLNDHVQQYYVFDTFLPRMADRTFPVERDVFYPQSREGGAQPDGNAGRERQQMVAGNV